MNKLDDAHWKFEDYKQRMTTKDWRDILLNKNDTIIFRGRLKQLKAKRLGSGIVEIYKK